MIIRSQDKGKITNFNLVTDLVISKSKNNRWEIIACYSYFATSDCGYAPIGEYSTGEKAIKVLDMIQSAYNAIETMKIDKGAWRDNHYFQMPSDEEVEV